MPVPFDPDIEAGLQDLLHRLRAQHDAEHGPGSFDQTVQTGRLMLHKRAENLTAEERAFLASSPPAQQH